MLYRIISLAFLFILVIFFHSEKLLLADNKSLILPKKKPIFKVSSDILRNTEGKLLPTPKPVIQKTIKDEENKKIIETKEKKIKVNIEKVDSSKNKTNFILPKKKPISYKTVSTKAVNKSEILSTKDFAVAKEVFTFIKAKKWNSALKLSKKVKDKEFRNLVTWMYLKEKGNRASFNDYVIFIKNNPDYPRINRLRYLAEHKIISKNTTPKSIINWFETPPFSGYGKIKLGEAYLAQGETQRGAKLIKEGWIDADLTSSNLKFYRNKFKKIISTEDHIKRADYLAWNKKYWDLKRLLKYLLKDKRLLYNARQILMSNSYGVDNAISNVPASLKADIGLQYDRLKWRNRRGRLESSLEILNQVSNKSETDLVRADLWWKQRESIVRTLIYKKRYAIAYKIANEHALTSGPEYAEAEWLSGWVALTFLKSPEYAVNHFKNFYENVGYPISLGRGAYWLGRTYKTLGDEEKAKKYFTEGSKFLTTYYGQLSFKEINENYTFEVKDQTNFSSEYQKEFNKNKLIKHVILLKELDQSQRAKDIIKHLATLNIEDGSEVLAAKLSTEIGRYDFAIQISKKASYEKRFYNLYNYPIITTPRVINGKKMPNPELILAIIRQESEFDAKANSYVGARGMMQLMKYTAKIVAKKAKLPYSISRLTKDPEYNIKLGSYYFDSLLNDYGGVYPFAIAAYNAGPNRVKTWRRINGDPVKNQIDYINWIELIRFKETRNYVQRVLENVNVYKFMLNKKPVELERFF